MVEDQKPVSLTPPNRKRTTVKNSQTNLAPNDCQLNSNQDVSPQKPFSKSTEMQLLTGSVSFLPELHLQGYPSLLDNTATKTEDPYVPPTGKSKPGMMMRSYEAMKQSKLSKLIRYTNDTFSKEKLHAFSFVIFAAYKKIFLSFRNKDVRYSVGLYTTFSFAVVAEHEMYSLWAATGREYGELPLRYSLSCPFLASITIRTCYLECYFVQYSALYFSQVDLILIQMT